MKKGNLVVASALLLFGCSESNFICEEGFSKIEGQNGAIIISCENPEFEFSCDLKTYIHIDDNYSCTSFSEEKYSVIVTQKDDEQSENAVKEVQDKAQDVEEVEVTTVKSVQNKPVVPAPVELKTKKITCTIEDWDCGSWGNCNTGILRRDCLLKADCEVEDIFPETKKTCEVSEICHDSDWDCTEWTYCIKGARTRKCELKSTDCRVVKQIETEIQCSDFEAYLQKIYVDIEKRKTWLNEWDGVAKELSSKSANEIYAVTNPYRKKLSELNDIYNDIADGKATIALVGYRIDNFVFEMNSLENDVKDIVWVYPAK
ncbi:hypothetical protein COU78_02500 [Candidatus Peregrinibacteria bacterium CG10_big_fil_rev_8_21_14_0_10_49_24]|nr:MAG: hypothetical protein COV83_02480 [Candidatus Peregrinibacteria bacterium CG11_big_fil_rev_8_21_14_0_20_49_14]PIR51007.1 MAG: hypothetical protein COU78_02500 [Candidatus Peregrinibacteria bacterium CG10_big_fil_rev_8_21_14_0_10_49_24]PJA67560.1 MAG: hypothetical protein CO157_03980 [Candidatus Peregrinibacteria bacterium CG_4_9_14_3_um_filter_49_12]